MYEVAEDVFLIAGTAVNWVIVREGSDLTLIDTGYPGDAKALDASIGHLGHRIGDVAAVLLTHAHADHTGSLNRLWRDHGIPVYMHPLEVANAKAFFREQVTPSELLWELRKPATWPWLRAALGAGAAQYDPVTHAAAFPRSGALDLPGAPVPIACPGHTSGSCAYFLPRVGALATGDALVTGHPLSRRTGPQLLPSFFNHSERGTISALDVLADVEADVVLPGHGDAWRGSLRDAAARAARGTH